MARWNSANMSRYYHLFKRIAEAGHTVIVVQPPPRISEETNYIDLPMQNHGNIILHTVSVAPWLWNMKFPVDKFVKKALYTLQSMILMRRLLRQHEPDLLVVYNLPQYVYTFRSDIPVVFDFADDYLAMLQHELGVSKHNVLYRTSAWILGRLIRKSALVFCVSKLLQEKIPWKSSILLPNGASPTHPDPGTRTLHIDKSKPVIGYVGAFEYFIDIGLMLQAAERLPDCTFLLVGAGRDFQKTKEAVAQRKLGNVILTGAVPHHQAMQFILEMDICLNLFVKGDVANAASPIKLFEYLVNRKPVITTRLVEIHRIDPSAAVFFYADSLDELLGAIRTILTDKNECERHMRCGNSLIESGFTWDALANKFVLELETLVERTAKVSA